MSTRSSRTCPATGRASFNRPHRLRSEYACDHELDAEYLYPSDADVLSITDDAGDARVTLALPCPNCGQALSLEATVDTVEEGDFDLPLDDEMYD